MSLIQTIPGVRNASSTCKEPELGLPISLSLEESKNGY